MASGLKVCHLIIAKFALANGKRGMSSDHRKIHSLARKTAKLCNENVSISSIFFYLIHFLSKVIAISQFM